MNASTRVIVLKALCLVFAFVVSFSAAERSYTASIEKMEVTEGEYVSNMKIKVTKYNRTVTVINGTVDLLKDAPLNSVATVDTYEKLGTEYKKSMVLFREVKLCEFIKKEKKVYPDIVKTSNLPEECPLSKGSYYIKNYQMNEDNLPERVPGEYWRVDVSVSSDDHVFIVVQIYIRIKHHIRRTMF